MSQLQNYFIDFFSILGLNPTLLKLMAQSGVVELIIILNMAVWPIIGLLIFYKWWDPIQKSKMKYGSTLAVIGLFAVFTSGTCVWGNDLITQWAMLNDNVSTMYSFGSYLCVCWFVLSLLISFFYSFFLKRISISNPKNPF